MKIARFVFALALVSAHVQPGLAASADPAAGGNKSKVETLDGKTAECKISCVDPHPCCAESEKVLGILQRLAKAYSEGDIKVYEEYLDAECTTFNEGTKKSVKGKDAILAELRESFKEHAADGTSPMVSFTIDQPFAKVNGDTCVVTFVARREIGGKQPAKQVAHITDIFIKRADGWKKLHMRGRWEKEKTI